VTTGLRVPWGLAFLPDGTALVAERPTGRVVRIGPDGGAATAGTVPGVADQGEGGLLGLAVVPGGGAAIANVYAYFTSTSGDNRVVRMPYRGGRLGAPAPVLTGIPAAGNHNGGRIVLGPDGNLWIGTGDAGDRAESQDRGSLGGKILRIRPDGSVPRDNPFPGSPVWSYGHRNVQGLAFDSRGQLWATEFGQNTWDELNKVTKGGNHGWPDVEGRGEGRGLVDPQVVWRTDEASPSGLAILGDVAYVAGLRGERLWQVPVGGGTAGRPVAALEGRLGRLRTVEPDPDGGLWVTTSNRDGRGSPADGDDRIVRLAVGRS
jgi:glucose/arabinose dehydrogenase